MSFYEILEKYEGIDLDGCFQRQDRARIDRIVDSMDLSEKDLMSLLSPDADGFLETMAQKAHETSLKYFGKTIQLYTPLYLSDHCDNKCVYCGFNSGNDMRRRTLSLEEVKNEAEFIALSGLKHVLILTGGSRKEAPVSYIKECVNILKKYFSSISIEIYALRQEEYAELIGEGVDGITIYQEVYDREVYGQMHPEGPKRDYMFRIDAPERALAAGMRTANIGALLGLNDWRKEVFFTGLHAKYLQDKFSDAEISISLPRIRPQVSNFQAVSEVTDRNIVQIITALRIFLPRVGITLSTRESSFLRDNLLPLGVTKMSAGSTTKVGGHTIGHGTEDVEQFKIYDKRNVSEMKEFLKSRGYQPVLKDWVGN